MQENCRNQTQNTHTEMATAKNGTTTFCSIFYHPQHMLVSYHYDATTSAHGCAACERVVTGAGYRCGACDFNIHEACVSLPGSVSFDLHPEHEFTLTRLTASRCCGVCTVASHAGSFMYRCVPCDLSVHPRCTSLLDNDGGAAPGQQQHRQRGARRKVAFRAFKIGFKVGLLGARVADMMTGGLLSPVIDAVDTAVGGW